MGSLQMDDDDDEISNYVDLHMYMLGGGWKWQDLQGLLWWIIIELMGYVDDSEMPMYCGGRGGSVGSNSGVGERKVEFMGRIGGGSFAKRSMVARDGLGGDGFVVDGGRSSSKSRKDEEDGGVENKSSMGSRLIATGELIVGDSGGVIIGEVGGAPEVLVLFSLGIMKRGKTQEVGVKKKSKNGALFIEEVGCGCGGGGRVHDDSSCRRDSVNGGARHGNFVRVAKDGDDNASN
ncbi:hypothetical protein Tco_0908961 [Tanacetum coccineum]|uniref:Uncharacterized protein n=1 Tax=Tanacetum coccineum TaxID=301880 RepID=A0ABQ5CNL8_9ASTR